MTVEILPPLSASVQVRPRGWRFAVRLWLRLLLFWLVLLPLLILALPLLLIAGLVFGFRVWKSLRLLSAQMTSAGGGQDEGGNPGPRIFFRIR